LFACLLVCLFACLRVCLLQDAHTDINSPSTSVSGNVHGMSVAFLMKLSDCLDSPGFQWMHDVPILKPENIVYVGLRDVDAAEREIMRAHNIKAFTMQDVDRHGIGNVMNMAIEHLHGKPLHLSVDIDAVDPILAAATGTKVRGGLTFREAHYLCESVAETQMLGSMDIVEVNPTLCNAPEDTTLEMALGMVESALGVRIL
jgi:arginase